MRFHQHKLVCFIVLSITALQFVFTGTAGAFPGNGRDERCAELIAAAIAATPEGETPVIPDDCLEDTGMTAIELRAAEAEMRLEPAPDVVQVPTR